MRLAVFAAMMLLTACSDDDNTAEPLKLSGVTTLADMNTTIAEAWTKQISILFASTTSKSTLMRFIPRIT